MKIRKQTFSLGQYLKLMNAETIRSDQDCQRLSGQWNNNMIGELIATVLTDNYIPPIILGEETVNEITRLWIIDGLQRSSTLSMFRYGNIKIAKSLDEYMVTYQRKILDENGNPKRDRLGEIMWESAEFDIRVKRHFKWYSDCAVSANKNLHIEVITITACGKKQHAFFLTVAEKSV